MNKKDAHDVLEKYVTPLIQCEFSQLAMLAESKHTDLMEAAGPSGVRYQIEIQYFWDHRPGGAVRVLASIDDGGFFTSILPLTQSWLIEPSG
jgi:hypothetical protein